MVSILKVSVAGLLMAFLVGCVTNGVDVGTSPLSHMGKSTKTAYSAYRMQLEKDDRYYGVFVYDAGSKTSAWWLKGGIDGPSVSESKAVESCRKSGATDCRIFDYNGRIVWKGISSALHSELMKPVGTNLDTTIYEYESGSIVLSYKQKQAYRNYLKYSETQMSSSFFISEDKETTSMIGSSINTNYYLTIGPARDKCLIGSNGKRCYLFAKDGKPINNAAKLALTDQ